MCKWHCFNVFFAYQRQYARGDCGVIFAEAGFARVQRIAVSGVAGLRSFGDICERPQSLSLVEAFCSGQAWRTSPPWSTNINVLTAP